MIDRDPDERIDEDEYIVDADAPKTDAEKSAAAEKELDAVTKLSLSIAAIATGLAFVVGSAALGKGVLLGSVASILNLRVLAKAGWAMLAGKGSGKQALLGFVGSFALLIGAACFVAFVVPDWVLGFGLGLAMPAVVGVAWAMRRSK